MAQLTRLGLYGGPRAIYDTFNDLGATFSFSVNKFTTIANFVDAIVLYAGTEIGETTTVRSVGSSNVGGNHVGNVDVGKANPDNIFDEVEN